MSRYFAFFILLSFLATCTRKNNDNISTSITISPDSLQQISIQWKSDSLGCSRQRDPKKIRKLISQLELTGKDSLAVIQYLGHPDGRNFLNDTTVVFYYFMACGVKQSASYNFYCNFERGKLATTQTAVLN
jgi:hypothetical protein